MFENLRVASVPVATLLCIQGNIMHMCTVYGAFPKPSCVARPSLVSSLYNSRAGAKSQCIPLSSLQSDCACVIAYSVAQTNGKSR